MYCLFVDLELEFDRKCGMTGPVDLASMFCLFHELTPVELTPEKIV